MNYAKQIAEPGASPERIQAIADFISAIVYGVLCSAGNRVFEVAKEWDK